MADDLEKRANALFVDEEFDEALTLYNQAVEQEPYSANLYISRAAAHLKLENFTDAVADANKAISIDPSLSKAYLRKGAACFALEEYQTAKAAFTAGSRADPGSAQFKTWIRKCAAELAEEEEEGSAGANAGEPAPPQSHNGDNASVPTAPAPGLHTSQPAAPPPSTTPASPPAGERAPAPPAASTGPPPPRFRHEFYQTPTHVTVTVFAKGVRAEDLEADFGAQFLSVAIRDPDGGEPFELQLRLFAKIVPEQCKAAALKTKVEVRLRKAEESHWAALQHAGEAAAKRPPSALTETAAAPAKVYPTSGKKVRDWDKLEAQIKEEEKGEKLEGDAALNKLFQDIYAGADEDTRRAMNKSFQESGGSVLSTSWKDVGSRKVEAAESKRTDPDD